MSVENKQVATWDDIRDDLKENEREGALQMVDLIEAKAKVDPVYKALVDQYLEHGSTILLRDDIAAPFLDNPVKLHNFTGSWNGKDSLYPFDDMWMAIDSAHMHVCDHIKLATMIPSKLPLGWAEIRQYLDAGREQFAGRMIDAIESRAKVDPAYSLVVNQWLACGDVGLLCDKVCKPHKEAFAHQKRPHSFADIWLTIDNARTNLMKEMKAANEVFWQPDTREKDEPSNEPEF